MLDFIRRAFARKTNINITIQNRLNPDGLNQLILSVVNMNWHDETFRAEAHIVASRNENYTKNNPARLRYKLAWEFNRKPEIVIPGRASEDIELAVISQVLPIKSPIPGVSVIGDFDLNGVGSAGFGNVIRDRFGAKDGGNPEYKLVVSIFQAGCAPFVFSIVVVVSGNVASFSTEIGHVVGAGQ